MSAKTNILEAGSGPSLDADPDSDLQTRACNPDSDAITLDVDARSRIMIPTRPAALRKIQTRTAILTYGDFARFEGIDPRTIFYRATHGLVHRIEVGRGRNGKAIWVIPVSALSEVGRARYRESMTRLDPEAVCQELAPAPVATPDDARSVAASAAEPLIHHEEHGPEASAVRAAARGCRPPASGHPLADRRGQDLAGLNDEGVPVLKSDPRLVYEAGLVATRSRRIVEEFFRRRRIVQAVEAAMAAVPHGEEDLARRRAIADLRKQRENAKLTYGTVRRWQGDAKKHGEQRLVPRWARREGSKTIVSKLQAELEAFFAQEQRPTFKQAFRHARRWCLAKAEATGQHVEPPSEHAVERFLKRCLEKRRMAIEAGRYGMKHFADTFEFHVRRDWTILPVNTCWILDHRCMDTHVILPSGKIGRPWLTAILDGTSADLVGWVLREQVSSDGVACASRRAMLGFSVLNEITGEWVEFPERGVPAYYYLDRGKEFHAKHLAGGRPKPAEKSFSPKDLQLDPEHESCLFDSLGIQRVTAIRKSARSKPIEPWFNAFATRVENLIAGHCGRNTVDKPEALLEHKKRGELLSWTQYLGVLASAINTFRFEQPIGDRDRPPADYWIGHKPNLPDPAKLDLLLLRKENKTIRGCGIEIIDGKAKRHYLCDDPEFVWAAGADVEVRWTPDDPDAIIAIHPSTGRRWVLPRVDLGRNSHALMFGEEMPAAQRLVLSGRGKARQLIAGYKYWARQQLTPECADPTGSLRVRDINGREIRAIAREFGHAAEAERAAEHPPAPERPPLDPSRDPLGDFLLAEEEAAAEGDENAKIRAWLESKRALPAGVPADEDAAASR